MISWLKNFVGVIATKVGVLIVVIGAALLVVQVYSCRAADASARAKEAENAELRSRLEATVRELGGVQGTLNTERELNAKLTAGQKEFVAAVKKVDRKATVTGVAKATVTVKDTSPGVVAETFVEDAHHRFRFDLPSGLLHRQQRFTIGTVFVRGADGTYRAASSEFREYDPVTGEEIPSTGVGIEGEYSFSEEKAPGPGPWHPRIVAAIGGPFSVGLGVQVNPYKWLTLGGLLMYQPTPKVGFVAATAGYRLFNSTVAVGPFVGVNWKGSVVGGGVATIELTR